MARSDRLQFGRLAKYYDLLCAEKDYRAEVQVLEGLARRYGRSRGRAWLDVACGTGRHLELLRRRHTVTGVDQSRQMLRIARARLPGVPLHCADMRTFRLEDRFDVVTCLFGAIGHLGTERDLRRTFANLSRHLQPGGIAVVEPWIDPAAFTPGYVAMASYRSPELTVVRMAFSSRKGNRSLVHYDYMVGEAEVGIRHFATTETGLLVSRRVLLDAMADAGLKARFLSRGFTPGRGLVLGTKPRPSG